MIPTPATVHQLSPYVGRVRSRGRPLLDFHRGSAALGDIEGGLDTHRWTAEYEPGTGNILIYRDDLGRSTAHIEHTVANVKRLVFAFDQNMRPVLGWVLNGGTSTFLRYYIALENAMGVIELPGITDPCVTLDDSREYLITTSDVLLGYTRDGFAYLRAQRDNFTVEYPFGGDAAANIEMVALAMNTQLRIQAMFKGTIPPVPFPNL